MKFFSSKVISNFKLKCITKDFLYVSYISVNVAMIIRISVIKKSLKLQAISNWNLLSFVSVLTMFVFSEGSFASAE